MQEQLIVPVTCSTCCLVATLALRDAARLTKKQNSCLRDSNPADALMRRLARLGVQVSHGKQLISEYRNEMNEMMTFGNCQ